MDAVMKAITMMGIALPTMFGVILVFILVIKLLHKAFPAPLDQDSEE
jgi:hypothetical protein